MVSNFDDSVCKAIWGAGNVEWAYRKAEGRAGGIISLWDADKFIRSSSWDMDGVVIVNGFWKDNGWRCCVVNIYSPCILAEKLDLWDRILGILE
ncbi:hypothetical protein ACS0TY_006343 [Phlomoides rotata]